jgi:hypothetical protein
VTTYESQGIAHNGHDASPTDVRTAVGFGLLLDSSLPIPSGSPHPGIPHLDTAFTGFSATPFIVLMAVLFVIGCALVALTLTGRDDG